ncbi:MAG: GIY-YIG nuclease family protein [Armatimonadetes bacterium]|nr:GIY-YIG nuclease family protein [Armatimonadota bacterium]
MFFVYILWSESRQRFYMGHSADLEDRLTRHNEGRSKATKPGVPWILKYTEDFETKALAVRRELEIKSWKSADRIKELIGERPA